MMLHPAASTFGGLIAIRLVFAVGAAASVCMLTAILADYPTSESKGRVTGVVGLMTGCGALLGNFLFLTVDSSFSRFCVSSNSILGPLGSHRCR